MIGIKLECETCRQSDHTYIDVLTDFFELDLHNQFVCTKCDQLIKLEYCRGHDMYFEISCPYCDKLKAEF